MLQTYQESTKVIECILKNDYPGFMENELETRIKSSMPPFSKIATIMISAASQTKAQEIAKGIARKAPLVKGIKILGPAPTVINKIKDKYRYNILIVCDKNLNLQQYIAKWLQGCQIPSYAAMKVNIDPYSII